MHYEKALILFQTVYMLRRYPNLASLTLKGQF